MKKYIKNKLFGLVALCFSFRFAQNQLIKIKRIISYFVGLGYGGEIKYSGELKVLKEIIKASSSHFIVYDVGSNKGEFIKYSYLYSKKYSKQIQCHAFEPNKFCFDHLVSTYGEYEKLFLNMKGLSDNKNKNILYYDHEFSGSSSLLKPDDIESYNEMKIDTISLDEYTQEDIDLLKIDVEGYEMNVIKSGAELISNRKIKNILFEFGGQGLNSRIFFFDIYKFFTDHNYTLYRITPTGYLYEIKYWEFTLEYFSATNYLATLNALEYGR